MGSRRPRILLAASGASVFLGPGSVFNLRIIRVSYNGLTRIIREGLLFEHSALLCRSVQARPYETYGQAWNGTESGSGMEFSYAPGRPDDRRTRLEFLVSGLQNVVLRERHNLPPSDFCQRPELPLQNIQSLRPTAENGLGFWEPSGREYSFPGKSSKSRRILNLATKPRAAHTLR